MKKVLTMMWILVKVTDEDYERLSEGRKVVGEIRRTEDTFDYVLKSFSQSAKQRKRSRLLCQLPNGRFSESEKLYKMYVAVSKLLDVDTIDQVFDSNVQKAMTLLKVKNVINK